MSIITIIFISFNFSMKYSLSLPRTKLLISYTYPPNFIKNLSNSSNPIPNIQNSESKPKKHHSQPITKNYLISKPPITYIIHPIYPIIFATNYSIVFEYYHSKLSARSIFTLHPILPFVVIISLTNYLP